jgi:MarR family transcriptional regulator, organic hydroperoxide resistance regulator
LRSNAAKALDTRKVRGPATSSALPLTISRAALLERSSDQRFRTLIHDLFTIADRMNVVRAHLGRRLGLTGPQYSLLVTVAQLQGTDGVSVGRIANTLHVSSAFVASQSGILVGRRLLVKQQSSNDRRNILISLTPTAIERIKSLASEIRSVNDIFFATLDRATFKALATAAADILESSAKAVAFIEAAENRRGKY